MKNKGHRTNYWTHFDDDDVEPIVELFLNSGGQVMSFRNLLGKNLPRIFCDMFAKNKCRPASVPKVTSNIP